MKARAIETGNPVNRPAAAGRGWLWFGLLILAGLAARGLRFEGRFGLWAHWDEVRLAVPALGILQGEFPIHQLGVEYMGAFPAYLLAPWFLVFGRSPLSLDCFAFGSGFFLWGTGYLVARSFAGRRAAVGYALILAVPPLLLNQWSLNGNLNYPFLLVLGNIVLLLSRLLFFGRNKSAVVALAAGLLAGLGWWNNLLVLVYLLPTALLALRTLLIIARPFWFLPLGFILGSLPAGLYELGHFPSARLVTFRGGDDPIGLGTKATLLLADSFPRLLGLEPDKLGEGAWAAAVALALLGACLLLAFIVRDAGEMAWLVGLRPRPGSGRILLWGVLAANLALILATPRGGEIGGTGIRYLLPLYSVLPVWLGEALERMGRSRKTLAVGALAGWLGLQSWINYRDTVGSVPAAERRWAALLNLTEPLRTWLEARGLHRIYLEDPPGLTSFEFTFLTAGRIVAADPWREEYLPHAVLVDGAEQPPFVTGRKDSGPGALTRGTAGTLKALGWEPEVAAVGAFEIIRYKRQESGGYEALSPRRWRLTTHPHPEAAGCLVDRDAATGWTTAGPQEPGQRIIVDLGGRERLGRMDLWSPLWQDVPQSFRLEGSLDGRNWQSLAAVVDYRGPFFSAGPHPFLKVRRGRVQVVFPPRDLRYLRFTQQGRSAGHSWSAHEIHLYRPAPGLAEQPSPADIFSSLQREGIRLFYADPWLSAGINRLSGGAIRTVPYNLYVNAYGRRAPAPEAVPAARLQKGTALFLQKEADGDEVRNLLAGQPAVWKEVPTRGGTLLVFTGAREKDRPLSRENWRITAGETREFVKAVLEGRRSTGWQPDWTTGAGRLQIDLGRRRPLQRLRVDLETPGGGCQPLLTVSEDGRRWEGLSGLSWSGPVFFDGWGVIRNGENRWDVRFPSRSLRYLRLEFPRCSGSRGPKVLEVFGYE